VGLFKDEVYQRMDAWLAGPSNHNGIEEAIRAINADAKLQDFLRQYAAKNSFMYSPDYFTYGHGSIDKKIQFWQGKPLHGYGGEEHGASLLLAPTMSEPVAPVFFRHWYQDDGTWYSKDLLVKDVKGGYHLNDTPTTVEHYPDSTSRYHGTRLIDTGVFDGVSAKDILGGLEKTIAKILAPKKKPRKRWPKSDRSWQPFD
jgi:hypothetical protein